MDFGLVKRTCKINKYSSIVMHAGRLLARILKVGVQILCRPKAHRAWRRRRHAPRGVWGYAPQKILKN